MPSNAQEISTPRDALTARVLPEMQLSAAANPLTAPLSDNVKGATSIERSVNRFKVEGNAISTHRRSLPALS